MIKHTPWPWKHVPAFWDGECVSSDHGDIASTAGCQAVKEDAELISLAPMAPHECPDSNCPGNRNRMILLAAELSVDDGIFFCKDDNGEFAVAVICNDVFGYACADTEIVPWNEFDKMLAMHKADPKMGLIRWAVQHSGVKPIPPVAKALEAGNKNE